jgi:hypothetical protein
MAYLNHEQILKVVNHTALQLFDKIYLNDENTVSLKCDYIFSQNQEHGMHSLKVIPLLELPIMLFFPVCN